MSAELETRYWNGHEADCLRRGGPTRYVRQYACSCGFSLLLDQRDAAIRRADLDRTLLVEWAERFLGGLSFNEPVLLEQGWAKRRAPDLADSILAALRSQESQKPPETEDR